MFYMLIKVKNKEKIGHFAYWGYFQVFYVIFFWTFLLNLATLVNDRTQLNKGTSKTDQNNQQSNNSLTSSL